MNENYEDGIEGGYTIMPRSYVRDYRNGHIAKPELSLLMWLRAIADLRGVSTVTMNALATEAFNKAVGESYINKLLLSLKDKKLIWYQERKGRRGSFEVHHGDWFLKNRQVKCIADKFKQTSVRRESPTAEAIKLEVGTVDKGMSQKIESRRRAISAMLNRS